LLKNGEVKRTKGDRIKRSLIRHDSKKLERVIASILGATPD